MVTAPRSLWGENIRNTWEVKKTSGIKLSSFYCIINGWVLWGKKLVQIIHSVCFPSPWRPALHQLHKLNHSDESISARWVESDICGSKTTEEKKNLLHTEQRYCLRVQTTLGPAVARRSTLEVSDWRGIDHWWCLGSAETEAEPGSAFWNQTVFWPPLSQHITEKDEAAFYKSVWTELRQHGRPRLQTSNQMNAAQFPCCTASVSVFTCGW